MKISLIVIRLISMKDPVQEFWLKTKSETVTFYLVILRVGRLDTG